MLPQLEYKYIADCVTRLYIDSEALHGTRHDLSNRVIAYLQTYRLTDLQTYKLQ